LAVAFGLSEALWIKFKVFGNMILMFLFVLGQMPLLARFIETDDTDKDKTHGDRTGKPTSPP